MWVDGSKTLFMWVTVSYVEQDPTRDCAIARQGGRIERCKRGRGGKAEAQALPSGELEWDCQGKGAAP